MSNNKLKIAELFCGAGGFAEGAKNAGFEHIWGVDNHEDSCKTFEKNQKCEAFNKNIEDFSRPSNLKKIKKDFGKIDGLLFGFPCNDFSLVGKKEKMEGKFGGLYKYACKVLNFFEPEFFVAENVTALGKKLKFNSSEQLLVKDICSQSIQVLLSLFKIVLPSLSCILSIKIGSINLPPLTKVE